MMNSKLKTKFAPPERSTREDAEKGRSLILQHSEYAHVLDAFPEIVLVLDKNRQAVYAGKRLLEFLKTDIDSILGKRPGEIFGCIHATEEAAGCGTSIFCRECGAVNSILKAQVGEENYSEFRVSVKSTNGMRALDLSVWSIPFNIDGEPFTLFTIHDIANQKRREALEHTFFHDVLNEASVLIGSAELIADGLVPSDINQVKKLRDMARIVVDTIQEQRSLLAAEDGSLKIEPKEMGVKKFLDGMIEFYRSYNLARDRMIELSYNGSGDEKIVTDKAILQRVIGNLIKNALEATTAGAAVIVSYFREEDDHIFSVHNKEVMPENVRLQVFQRSFSTKGKGRGIGTYSVKFITEQYLGGKVYFESIEGKGTTFYLRLKAS